MIQGLNLGLRKQSTFSAKCPDWLWSLLSFLFSGYGGGGGGWWVKPLGYKANHSPPSNAEVKNEWTYTSTAPICLHVMYRGNVTFLFTFFLSVLRLRMGGSIPPLPLYAFMVCIRATLPFFLPFYKCWLNYKEHIWEMCVFQIGVEQHILVLDVTEKIFCIIFFPVLKFLCFQERN
jgi:hypothetical protein